MIPSNVTCPLADCPKKDECARHSFYLKALAESESITVLNTTRFHTGPDGCEHFIVPQKVRLAYGFRRLADTIPTGKARNMIYLKKKVVFWSIPTKPVILYE